MDRMEPLIIGLPKSGTLAAPRFSLAFAPRGSLPALKRKTQDQMLLRGVRMSKELS